MLNLRSCRPHQRPKERLPWFRFVKVRALAFAMRWASSSGETPTRYIYRNRAGTAFVSKGSLIHLAPCTGCVDYQEREQVA